MDRSHQCRLTTRSSGPRKSVASVTDGVRPLNADVRAHKPYASLSNRSHDCATRPSDHRNNFILAVSSIAAVPSSALVTRSVRVSWCCGSRSNRRNKLRLVHTYWLKPRTVRCETGRLEESPG